MSDPPKPRPPGRGGGESSTSHQPASGGSYPLPDLLRPPPCPPRPAPEVWAKMSSDDQWDWMMTVNLSRINSQPYPINHYKKLGGVTLPNPGGPTFYKEFYLSKPALDHAIETITNRTFADGWIDYFYASTKERLVFWMKVINAPGWKGLKELELEEKWELLAEVEIRIGRNLTNREEEALSKEFRKQRASSIKAEMNRAFWFMGGGLHYDERCLPYCCAPGFGNDPYVDDYTPLDEPKKNADLPDLREINPTYPKNIGLGISINDKSSSALKAKADRMDDGNTEDGHDAKRPRLSGADSPDQDLYRPATPVAAKQSVPRKPEAEMVELPLRPATSTATASDVSGSTVNGNTNVAQSTPKKISKFASFFKAAMPGSYPRSSPSTSPIPDYHFSPTLSARTDTPAPVIPSLSTLTSTIIPAATTFFTALNPFASTPEPSPTPSVSPSPSPGTARSDLPHRYLYVPDGPPGYSTWYTETLVPNMSGGAPKVKYLKHLTRVGTGPNGPQPSAAEVAAFEAETAERKRKDAEDEALIAPLRAMRGPGSLYPREDSPVAGEEGFGEAIVDAVVGEEREKPVTGLAAEISKVWEESSCDGGADEDDDEDDEKEEVVDQVKAGWLARPGEGSGDDCVSPWKTLPPGRPDPPRSADYSSAPPEHIMIRLAQRAYDDYSEYDQVERADFDDNDGVETASQAEEESQARGVMRSIEADDTVVPAGSGADGEVERDVAPGAFDAFLRASPMDWCYTS